MASENPSSFIRIDDLLGKVEVEQAARYYGALLPELKRVGQEIRTRCFLNCGKTAPTGNRALAIRDQELAKPWRCHQFGCGKGGNIIGLCDLMKPGDNMDGKPRGQRFKEIAADLQAMVQGETSAPPSQTPSATAKTPNRPKPEQLVFNAPLANAENERARGLIHLDSKLITDIAQMPPAASAYFRKRPFLTPEVCQAFRMGYLPRDAGEDRSGGTMRGRIVYAYNDGDGQLLTWFGRDPEFEAKHCQWENTDRTAPEPCKFRFVKDFHQGIELFGQDRLRLPEAQNPLRDLGIILVESPNDVIRLSALGVCATALCSTTITREQAQKTAQLARELADGIVTIFLDCDATGEQGMKQVLGQLAQLTPTRLAWTSKMHDGYFQGRKPESLKPEEWARIAKMLRDQRGLSESLS